jgi:sortase A
MTAYGHSRTPISNCAMQLFKGVASWLLIFVGSFLIFSGALDYYSSVSSQSKVASDWVRDSTPSTSPSPSPPNTTRPVTIQRGDPVARLSIPRLDAVLYVVEGADAGDLKRGPGHMEGTPLPGQAGNCIIAGHRDTHFRLLKDIRKGDEILLETHNGQFRYRVSQTTVISPKNTACLRPTTTGVLNLITCYPFYYVGPAPKRFIVHADLVS